MPTKWDVPLGARDQRTAIHSRHGGSESRGISAPGRTTGRHNIMLWWKPASGHEFGYADGWTADGSAFYFSGTGQFGDQRFGVPNAENGRVRDHLANGDAVRLLRYVGKNLVEYVAELRLDPQDPWRWVDGLDATQELRRMIQFRFLPVGKVLQFTEDAFHQPPGASVAVDDIAGVPAAPSETDVEALKKGEFKRLAQARGLIVVRRELVLVHAFRDWLATTYGISAEGLRIPYAVEGRDLRADLFLPTLNLLIEAKASVAREKVRLAIGQLLDYQRWVSPTPKLMILTPEQPAADMLDLLNGLGIAQAWRTAKDAFEVSPDFE